MPPRKRRSFSPEKKAEIVQEWFAILEENPDAVLSQFLKKYKLSDSTFRRWMHDYQAWLQEQRAFVLGEGVHDREYFGSVNSPVDEGDADDVDDEDGSIVDDMTPNELYEHARRLEHDISMLTKEIQHLRTLLAHYWNI